MTKQTGELDEKRVVYYKKGNYICDGYYIIEISSNVRYSKLMGLSVNYSHLFIAAYDVASPESFLIKLP